MIKIFTKDGCGYCTLAKALLESVGITYELTNITNDKETIESLLNDPRVKEYNHRTFPFVFNGDKFIGGYTELKMTFENGFFDNDNQDF